MCAALNVANDATMSVRAGERKDWTQFTCSDRLGNYTDLYHISSKF